MRVVQAFRREASNYRSFIGVNGSYREANQQHRQRSAPSTSRSSTCCRRRRWRSCSATAACGCWRATSAPARCSCSSACSPTSSTRCSSCRSSTRRSWPARPRWTRCSRCWTRSRGWQDAPAAEDLPEIWGRVRFERRPLQLPAGHGRGAARHLVRGRGRPDGRTGRPHRRRQVDDREAAGALLRPHRRPHPDRRPRPARRHDRIRCAGSWGSCRRRHSCSPDRCATTSRSGARTRSFEDVVAAATAVGADGFIRELPDGYDDGDRGARRAALDRPAPAGGVRAGAACRTRTC